MKNYARFISPWDTRRVGKLPCVGKLAFWAARRGQVCLCFCYGKHGEVVRVHGVQTYAGSRGIAPRILRLSGFTTEKNPSTQWIWDWSGHRARPGTLLDRQISCYCQKSKPDCTARCLIGKPTELPLLPLFGKYDTEIYDIRQQSVYKEVTLRFGQA
jgi:hypothetical protein